MDLLNSAIILILIALIWTGVLFLLYKRVIGYQSKKDQLMLFGGFILFCGMILIVVAGTAAYEYAESSEFCGTFCHIMQPYYDSYVTPGNNTMMLVHVNNYEGCSYCHEGSGIIGKIQGLLRAIPEVYLYYTNTYNPDDLGGNVPRDYCLKCHDNVITSAPGIALTVSGKPINPHTDQSKCTDCHVVHHFGLGLTEDTCTLCHGTSLDNFDEMLIEHGERVGSDCMECHSRLHPDDAKIPFKENPDFMKNNFCSDCHLNNYEGLSTESHSTEKCVDCHNEHRLLTLDFGYCFESCHESAIGHDSNLLNCSVCHDLSTIHLEPGVDLGERFSDIVCSNCHSEENVYYVSTFTPDSLAIYGENGCIDCHSEHKLISYPHLVKSPYENCADCHTSYDQTSEIHDRTGITYLDFLGITNNFCSDCHAEDYIRFSRELHNSLNCTVCHTEHAVIRVKFNNCIDCHDIPSDHDTSLTSCSGPSCHNEFRAIHSDV